jgi:hypothetical protein
MIQHVYFCPSCGAVFRRAHCPMEQRGDHPSVVCYCTQRGQSAAYCGAGSKGDAILRSKRLKWRRAHGPSWLDRLIMKGAE